MTQPQKGKTLKKAPRTSTAAGSSKSDGHHRKEVIQSSEAPRESNVSIVKLIDEAMVKVRELKVGSSKIAGTKNALIRAYLDIFNRGSMEELKLLKGIGGKRATEIIEYRETNPDPFQKLADLEHFGISTKLIKQLWN